MLAFAETNIEGVLGVMIPIIAIVGGLGLGFAGFYWRSRERMEMINRGMDVSNYDWPKRRRSPLRSGLTFVAVGAGFLVGMVFSNVIRQSFPGTDNSIIYLGFIFLFVGIARVTAYLIEGKSQDNTGGIK